jgi:hypothetical protein
LTTGTRLGAGAWGLWASRYQTSAHINLCRHNDRSERQGRGALYCDCASVVRSHDEPCQLVMVPLSPQTGHHHIMTSVSGSISVPITPSQGRRLWRRRHLTEVLLGSSQGSVVASTTILVKYSASFLAAPDFGPISPSLVRKCVRFVTQVFPIQPFQLQ